VLSQETVFKPLTRREGVLKTVSKVSKKIAAKTKAPFGEVSPNGAFVFAAIFFEIKSSWPARI
jgi:hypothetical protein